MEKKEAMKILKDFHDKSALFSVRTALDTIIPELKESEDERIKHEIKVILANTDLSQFALDYTFADMIAWLEKQGKFTENNEDDSDGDFTIYYPLKNGKGCYECIPYSFYGTLTSFSEDKDLIDFLRLCFYTKEECNEWIKKQGEHANFRNKIQVGDKVTRNEAGILVNISQLNRIAKPRVAKPTDKSEPKFHEGEWITNDDYTWKIIEVKTLDYILQSQDGNIVDDTISHVDEQFHSFTIEDAKDGDVLACESGWTCIFKTLVNDETFSSYCFMDDTKWFCEIGSECHTLKEEFAKAYNGKIHPATKEQRDLLFQKMKEAGYEWDAEKKELKKISQRMISAEAKEALYDKPTDKEMKELLRTEYEKGRADTLSEMKSSWSEVDDIRLQACIGCLQAKSLMGKVDTVMTNWLKSLKQRIKL